MSVTIPTTAGPLFFLVGYLVAGGISITFVAYIVRYRWNHPAGKAFAVVSIALSIWAFAYVGRLLSPSLTAKLFFTQLAWIGVTVTPVAVLAFVLTFTGKSQLVSRNVVAGLLVVPLLTQGMLLTNEFHALFYQDVWLTTDGSIPIIASRGGLWFYAVHIPYSWGLYFVATVLLIQFAFSTTYLYRTQSIALLFGAIFPWIVNGTYLSGIRIHPELDPTPIGFAVGMAAIMLAMFRVSFLGLIPVARDKVLDEVDECIFVFDDSDCLIDVNDAGKAFLDSNAPTRWSIGDAAKDVLPPARFDTDTLDRTRSATEVKLPTKGSDAWFLVRQYDLDGAVYSGRIVTLTDITTQKRQQALLEEKNDRLGRVGSILSHDLRNPLNVGTASVQTFADKLDETELTEADRAEFEAMVETLDHAHDRIETIIAEVLLLARSGNEVTAVDRIELDEVARTAWTHVESNGIELAIDGSKTLQGDRKRLLRVFENLFRNSVDHGESVTTVHVGPTGDGFYVEDDGVGIEAQSMQRIFEEGVSKNAHGTGIGLTIVRNVIEAHGWEVVVGNGDCGGARFEITGTIAEDVR